MEKKRFIAYIPARGGSKRIINKNRKLLGGKPIILHVIEILMQLNWIEKICVSTDDPEIKNLVESLGAIALDLRAKELSDDYCTFKNLLEKDIYRFEEYLKLKDDYNVLMVLPTAALINTELINKAKNKFLDTGADFLFAAKEYDISAFWAFEETLDGFRPLFSDKLNERSQDLPNTFSDAGLFYYLKSDLIHNSLETWFHVPNKTFYFTNKEIAIDVDTLDDWKLLEHYFFNRSTKN